MKGDHFLVFPRAVLVDTSEQLPYTMRGIDPAVDAELDAGIHVPYDFGGLVTDARDGRVPLVVPVRPANLPWGDYSLEGYSHLVAVERKTPADLYHNVGARRRQFEREIAVLDRYYEFAAVVVEAGWTQLVERPPPYTSLDPKVVHRTIISWMMRYPRVHWLPCGDRTLAQETTFRILERYLRTKSLQVK